MFQGGELTDGQGIKLSTDTAGEEAYWTLVSYLGWWGGAGSKSMPHFVNIMTYPGLSTHRHRARIRDSAVMWAAVMWANVTWAAYRARELC